MICIQWTKREGSPVGKIMIVFRYAMIGSVNNLELGKGLFLELNLMT